MKKLSVITILIIALLTAASCSNAVNPGQDEVLYQSKGAEAIELGEGNNHFDFSAVDSEGTVYNFHIHTNKTIVGEALEELGLIEGTEGDFGIYVNKVNGIYAEYEVTGTYWALYVNGEKAMVGIDMTEIVEGNSYSMKIEQ